MKPLSPDQRAWMTRMADQWAARAKTLRSEPGRSASVRASAVQDIVDAFRHRLALDRSPGPVDAIERVTKRLASVQPRPGPHGLTINGGAIMDAVRHQLSSQLAILRGEAAPSPPRRSIELTPIAPPAEPLPFTAGPQLDLFAFAAAA